MSNITETPSWKALAAHYEEIKNLHLRDMFKEDPERAAHFSVQVEDLLLDYSKNRVQAKTMELLFALAREAKLEYWRDEMFSGAKINRTENRAVLHTALRNRSSRKVLVDGVDVMPAVNAVIDKMCAFAQKVRNGEWLGFTGKPIRNIVNIGIGGSDLGPKMAVEALKQYATP